MVIKFTYGSCFTVENYDTCKMFDHKLKRYLISTAEYEDLPENNKPCDRKHSDCVPKCSELSDEDINRGLQCKIGKMKYAPLLRHSM